MKRNKCLLLSLLFAVIAAAPGGAETVDKPVPGQNEHLTYDLSRIAPIDLREVLPSGTVLGPGSRVSSRSAALDPLTLEWVPSTAPFGYIPLNIFFPPLTCSSECDDASISLPLGSAFFFDYAGASYTSVVMSSNGFVVAGGDSTNASTPSNQALPELNPPNNVIAPFWTDLDLDGTSPTDPGAGRLYAGFVSAGPTVYLILEWQGVELSGMPGPTFTFQIWIQLGTSEIWAVYALVPFFPDSLTVGLEGSAGTCDGSSRYFNGAGTAPAVGQDLKVAFTPGSCDQDGDGVSDDIDVCSDTAIPEGVPSVRLGTNRFALVDDDGVFDTKASKGRGPRKSFTIEETAGCSCEQIISALRLGKGHTKYGCSIGAMEDWVALVNLSPSSANVGLLLEGAGRGLPILDRAERRALRREYRRQARRERRLERSMR